jgi:hypothetical protein
MVLDPRMRLELAKAHADDLRRAGASASGSRLTHGLSGAARPHREASLVIRPERPQDRRALDRLAGLDSASVPSSPLLLAEVDGELRAALSLADGAAIADPFHRTATLVSLLTVRAEQLRGEPARARSPIARLRRAARRMQRLSAPAR